MTAGPVLSLVSGQSDISKYPRLTLVLQGLQLEIPPELLFYESTRSPGYSCGGISPITSGTLIGESVLRGFVTVYDRANARMGFVPAESGDFKVQLSSLAVLLAAAAALLLLA